MFKEMFTESKTERFTFNIDKDPTDVENYLIQKHKQEDYTMLFDEFDLSDLPSGVKLSGKALKDKKLLKMIQDIKENEITESVKLRVGKFFITKDGEPIEIMADDDGVFTGYNLRTGTEDVWDKFGKWSAFGKNDSDLVKEISKKEAEKIANR